MYHFYLHHPPLHKWFDLWDVEYLLSLLESWALASLTNFELAWKTATHFLQHHAAICVPASGGKVNSLGHLLPQICNELHSKCWLCSIWRLICVVLSLTGNTQMNLRFPLCSWVTIGSTYQYVLKWFLLG